MLGAHLLYELSKNNTKVRAIYRSENAIEKTRKIFSYDVENGNELFGKIEWCEADITDVPTLESVFLRQQADFDMPTCSASSPTDCEASACILARMTRSCRSS